MQPQVSLLNDICTVSGPCPSGTNATCIVPLSVPSVVSWASMTMLSSPEKPLVAPVGTDQPSPSMELLPLMLKLPPAKKLGPQFSSPCKTIDDCDPSASELRPMVTKLSNSKAGKNPNKPGFMSFTVRPPKSFM